MTILLTGSDALPAQRGGTAFVVRRRPAGAQRAHRLVHIDANRKAGASVSIPANVVVRVPGHGRMPISQSLRLGGPSLLIATVNESPGCASIITSS